MNKKVYTQPLIELDNIKMSDALCSSGISETFGSEWANDAEANWNF